jgi:hypothetical protein
MPSMQPGTAHLAGNLCRAHLDCAVRTPGIRGGVHDSGYCLYCKLNTALRDCEFDKHAAVNVTSNFACTSLSNAVSLAVGVT